MEDLQTRGLLVRSGRDRIAVSSDAGTVPAGLEDLVLAYLSQLDDAVVELLQAQAVLGSSATLEELAGVPHVPAGAAEDGCWCGCVRWVCGGAGRSTPRPAAGGPRSPPRSAGSPMWSAADSPTSRLPRGAPMWLPPEPNIGLMADVCSVAAS